MSSFISAAPVASGQVQSLDSLRGHSLPSDAMIVASATQVNPTNQNTGSYAIVESGVNSLGVTTTGSVPAVTLSPFADLYKEGSIYLNGTTGNYLQNTATYSNSTIQWNTTGMTVEAWVNYPTFTGASVFISANPLPTLFGMMTAGVVTDYWSFGSNTAGYVNFYYYNGSYQTVMSTTQLSANTWNHIAMTCSTSGQIFLFVNGVQTTVYANRNGTIGSAVNYETVQGTPTVTSTPLTVAGYGSTINAYVADLRLTTGTPVYTGSTGSLATFTVPSAPLSSTTSPGVTQFLLRAGANAPYVSNGALTFDRGVKSYMNFGPQTFNIVTQGFTAVWRGTLTGVIKGFDPIFVAGPIFTNGWIALLRSGSTSTFYLAFAPSNAGTQAGSSGTFTLNQNTSYVITARYTPSTQLVEIWVNGVNQSAATATITTASLVGDRTTNGAYLFTTGTTDFNSGTSNTFAIYNRALSNVEIYNSYLALTTVPATPLQKTLEIGDINGVPALSVAGNGQVSVQSIGLSSNVLPWPPAAMTGYDTVINGGVYKARASNELNSGTPAWYAFARGASPWASPASYSATSNLYTGTVTTTDVNGTVYPGEWLQVQLASQVFLSSYYLQINSTIQAPQKFVILGSRDGVNWFLVNSQSSASAASQTFTLSSSVPVQAFSYYRIVCNQLTGNNQVFALQQFILYGTADTSPTLTIAPATTFNTSVATPSLVGVSNPSFVPQDFSSSGLNVPAYVVSNTATTANTVQYSSFGPFAGEGSLYFPGGTGSYVNFGNQLPLWTGAIAQDCTIEFWINMASFPSFGYIIQRAVSISSSTYDWQIYIGNTGQMYFGVYNNGRANNYIAAAPSVVATNTWYHVAAVVKSSVMTVFLNGTAGTPVTISVNGIVNYSASSITYIGNGQLNGYITGLRLTQGQALYTTTFTPPTAPLQPIQGTTQAGLPYGTVLLLRNAPAPGRIQTTRLTGSNSGSVLSFPPAAMTGYSTLLNPGYGQGTYVASASSDPGAAWLAFDKNLGAQWYSSSTFSGSTPYASTATTTTDINGNAYQGEYLQLMSASSIVLVNYTLWPSAGGAAGTQSPAKWVVLGSRDGFNWNLVDSRSGVTSWTNGVSQTFSVSASQAFTYFRIVISNLNSTGTLCSLSEFILNGSIEGVNINPDGKVGLGVVNPTRALEVAGDVMCAGTLSAGNPLMFRNALYNGDMRIAQRGTSFTNPSGQYTLDRWYLQAYGAVGNGTVSQIQSGLANFSNAFQLATTSTTGGNWMISQSLETRDVVRLQGQPVTVSFWYRIPTSFTAQWGSGLFWTTSVDTAITNPVSPAPNSAGGGITLTNTTQWTYVQFQSFIPLTAQALSMIFVTYNNVVNGATIQITGVQLEKGSVATPFEVRPFATELALCQRYYEQSYSIGTAPGLSTGVGQINFSGSSDGSSNMYLFIRYAVPKRSASAAPVFYLQSGTLGTWTYLRSGTTGTATVNYGNNNEFCFSAYVNIGSAWTVASLYGHWVTNAEL